jgi:predicted ribosome quality control (RQC) complex YloA/Tae2 family protein
VLSLAELRRVTRVLGERFTGHRLERCVESGDDSLVLVLYGRDQEGEPDAKSRKRLLRLSCRSEFAHVGECAALPPAPQNPPAFVSWLRAHLSRARLVSARLLDGDRQLALGFEAAEGRFDLLLMVLGHKSNLYALDADGRVMATLRPPADTRPELTVGGTYARPASAAPREGEDRFASVDDAALLAAIEDHYSAREAERETGDLIRQIRHVLKRESKGAARRLEKIEAELAEADRASELQRYGELLKSSLGRIEPGASEVRVHDYASDEEVSVPLDPKLGPKENLDATFKRYQKLIRRLTKAGGQVDEARAWSGRVAELAERLAALCSASDEPDPAALRALAEEPDVARLLSKSRAARSSGTARAEEGPPLPARWKNVPRRLQPRRYESRDGLEIWVGRSDEGNDYLTTRLARGNDLFFHLDGAPGSHVILRTEGRPDPPPESILDACELAVHFSKQKNASRADVHVVPIKQVKKPKGAKRGLVWVTGGKSIHLRREEGRLTRLKQSVIE